MVVVKTEIHSVSDCMAKKRPLGFEFKLIRMHRNTDVTSLVQLVKKVLRSSEEYGVRPHL